jgi:hypothetical protein
MKFFVEHRTYEQHGDGWIEIDAARRPHAFLNRFTAVAKTSFALAALAAIGIVAAFLALILLPIAFVAVWWLRATPPIETRRPR